MNTFVRILSYILLIVTTIIFVLKVKIVIPVSYKQLIIVFAVGVISLLWATLREDKNNKRN